MRRKSSALVALACATAALGALVGTASANHLSTTSPTFRVAWTSMAAESALGTVSCPVTLEGSIHSASIAKTVGLLVGYVNRASAGTCTGGSARFLTETLPWHLQYRLFTGALPTIVAISLNVIGFAYQTTIAGIECLFRSSSTSPLAIQWNREAAGAFASVGMNGTLPSAGCGFEGRFTGTSAAPTAPGTSTKITLTLI